MWRAIDKESLGGTKSQSEQTFYRRECGGWDYLYEIWCYKRTNYRYLHQRIVSTFHTALVASWTWSTSATHFKGSVENREWEEILRMESCNLLLIRD